jgi:protoheme IX farnesyltransferase
MDAGFLVDSSLINGWLVKEAYRFWKHGGEKGNAKRLFWASVWHLPIVMVLAMAHKAGLWNGVYEKIVGREEEDEEEWEEGVVKRSMEEAVKEDIPEVKGWMR